MGKSVYSLLLTNEVMNEVDKFAWGKGVSRSGAIDLLLADALGCDTAEKRMNGIFCEMEKLVSEFGGIRFYNMPSASMASVTGVLNYRYRPTVKYTLELTDTSETLGRLKVSLRTGSESLLCRIESFFGALCETEKSFGAEAEVVNYRYERTLRRKRGDNAQDSAAAILGYIGMFGEMLDGYFSEEFYDLNDVYREYNAKNYV